MKSAAHAIVISLFLTTAAASDPPSPIPTKRGHEDQAKAGQNDDVRAPIGNLGDHPATPPTAPVIAAPQAQIGATENPKKTSDGSKDWVTWAFDLLLVGVGLLQWGTYRKQTQLLSSAQRAYVFLKQINCQPMSGADGIRRNWRFYPVFANSGSTPTRNSVVHTNFELRIDGLPEDFRFDDIWPPSVPRKYERLFIGPKAERSSSHIEVNVVDLDPGKRQRLFIWGWIDYSDTLHGTRRHRTEFAYEISIKTDPARCAPSGFDFLQLSRFNGADDECYRQPEPYKQTPL